METVTLDREVDRAREARGIARKVCSNGAMHVVYDTALTPEERRECIEGIVRQKTDDPLVRLMACYGVLERLSKSDPKVPEYLGLTS